MEGIPPEWANYHPDGGAQALGNLCSTFDCALVSCAAGGDDEEDDDEPSAKRQKTGDTVVPPAPSQYPGFAGESSVALCGRRERSGMPGMPGMPGGMPGMHGGMPG